MRILLIHQYFLEEDDGGGSRFNEMTEQWSKMGHEVTVIAGMIHANGKEKRPEYKGKWFVKKEQTGVNVLRCHVSESYNRGFLGRLWGYFAFVFSSSWGGALKINYKHDIILVTSPPLFVGITALILSRIKRIPYLFEVRDLWPESAIDTGVLKNKWIIRLAFWLEKVIYKRSSLINVLTPAFKERLMQEKGIPDHKIILIPNAADFSLSAKVLNREFDQKEFRNQISWDNHFVILYVGAHGIANHLIQIIQTAELCQPMKDVLFVLIGDGMEKEKLKGEVQKRNINNVQFLDPVPKIEVFKYIMAADFGMSVLKKVDTFKTIYSNKTFDYMSCKKPIFLLIDGVSRDLVDKAECGIYVEPENPEEFAKAIKDIKGNTKRITQMGLNGYNYAIKHFDRMKLSKKYIEEISKVIQG